MRKPFGACGLLLALFLCSGLPARAADPRTESARAHSQEGDAYYKLEKYKNAISEYEQAYLAKPDPSFLYNIAQCHRLMGEGSEAINFYRRFLKDAPNAPNREIAEKHIRDLEESGANGTASPPSPGAPSPSPPLIAPLAPPPAAALAPPPPSPVAPATPAVSSPPPAPVAVSLDAPPPPASTTPVVENAPAPSQTESSPFYHRWWFWTAVAAVVVGGIVLIATANRDPSCPGGYQCR